MGGHVLADGGQLRQVLFRLHHGREGPGEPQYGADRVAIGPDTKRIRPVDLQQIPELLEHTRDLDVLHGVYNAPAYWSTLMKSSSLRISTPRSRPFWSLEPGSAPTTT